MRLSCFVPVGGIHNYYVMNFFQIYKHFKSMLTVIFTTIDKIRAEWIYNIYNICALKNIVYLSALFL